MEILIQLLIIVGPLVVCGLIIGRYNEKKHFANINERESVYEGFLTSQLKSYPGAVSPAPAPPTVVVAEVVIASDYLKSFLSGWRKIFGGEMKSFTTMQERAKREVILRLIEQAHAGGFNAVCNVRVEGVDLGGNTSRKKVPMAAVIGSGTAYHAHKAPPVSPVSPGFVA